MATLKIVGVILVVLGALALIYGGFTYTKETHDAELGPLKFQVKDRERVNVPAWVGVASAVIGLALLFFSRSRPPGDHL